MFTKCNVMLQKCTTIQQQKCEDRALPQQVSHTLLDDCATCVVLQECAVVMEQQCRTETSQQCDPAVATGACRVVYDTK